MKSFTCIVEGKVADGRFQSWVRTAAEQLGLKGWVRNVENDKAEILVQGEESGFTVLEDRIKSESPVVDLKVVSCKLFDHDKEFNGFETRG